MVSRKPRVLVTSAAGRTGAAAVAELLRLGFPVRAFVRRDDARAAALRKAGAETVVGDLFDLRDLRRALVDVQRAYHCPPWAPNLLHESMLFALAAEEAKLEVVALMSAWNPHPSHPVVLTREHWIANNVYRWMPSVDVVHVNPGLFAFNYLLGLPIIAHTGMFMAPFGDGLNAPPSSEDIGRVAAGVLAEPARHVGRSYRPTGPKLLAPDDVAGILAKVLGRKVKYTDTPPWRFEKAGRAMGFPLYALAWGRRFYEELRKGAFAIGAPTDHYEAVCGRPPEDFETVARRYVAHPELIWPGLRIGTKLHALRIVLRMLRTRVPDLDRWEDEHYFVRVASPQLAHESAEWRAAAAARRLCLLPASRPRAVRQVGEERH
jgi:uncharacterized protein YbjT (DUF2867 family)